MLGAHGRFIWHELLATDVAPASKFYSDVLGWHEQRLDAEGIEYRIMHVGSQPVAAIVDASVRAPGDLELSGWIAYAYADDVDATVDSMIQHGGTLLVPPSDTPGVGRTAVAADPQGAAIGLFMPASGDNDPRHGDPAAPGKATWYELYADDPADAFPVYAEAFGWKKAAAFEMGPAGRYQLFEIGGQDIGGMMRRPAELPTATWNIFFQVADITSAQTCVEAGGGSVLFGPRPIPGGGFALICLDPWNAIFALSGPKL